MLDNKQNQPIKSITKCWVKINDDSRGAYKNNSQIKFKTTMLKLSLNDYSDTYIIVKGTVTIARGGTKKAARWADEKNKGVIFKNCASCTDYISDINNTQTGSAKDLYVVMPMYNLT